MPISPKRRKQKTKESRPSSSARGYGYRWEKYSKQYRLQHPLCVHCLKRGITTATECVDHIEPVSGPNDPLFWDPDNHQSLCNTCHGIKTQTEDLGKGRTR